MLACFVTNLGISISKRVWVYSIIARRGMIDLFQRFQCFNYQATGLSFKQLIHPLLGLGIYGYCLIIEHSFLA